MTENSLFTYFVWFSSCLWSEGKSDLCYSALAISKIYIFKKYVVYDKLIVPIWRIHSVIFQSFEIFEACFRAFIIFFFYVLSIIIIAKVYYDIQYNYKFLYFFLLFLNYIFRVYVIRIIWIMLLVYIKVNIDLSFSWIEPSKLWVSFFMTSNAFCLKAYFIQY